MKTSAEVLQNAIEELVKYQKKFEDIVEQSGDGQGPQLQSKEDQLLVQIAISALKEAEL